MHFTHPEFLWLLSAVLIPVLIHLFNFRRYKKVWFSNISFLKNITIETRKQNKLKHLILLLLRVIAVILIVLAFSGPRFGAQEDNVLNPGSVAVVYIDNSFSMMSEGESGRLFEQSLNEASLLAGQMPRDKQFILMTNEPASGRKVLSKGEFQKTLEGLQVSEKFATISSVINSAQRKREENEFQNAEIYLFSDFQQSIVDEENLPDDSVGKYYFVPLSPARKKNVYLDSCWFEEPLILPGRPVKLNVRIKNASDEEVPKIPIKVMVGGVQKAVSGVDLKPGEQKIVQMSFTLYKQGWKQGVVEIEDYPIVFDDHLFFAVRVSKQIKVLGIGTAEDNEILNSFYGIDSLFSFETVDYTEVDYNRLGEYNLVILNNLKNISSGLAGQLKDFVEAGNNLMYIPKASPDISDNQLLKVFEVGKIAMVDTVETRVSGINLSSNLFSGSVINIPQNADLPVVRRHIRIGYPVNSMVESLAVMLNGDDFLLKKNVGSGIVYILATSLDEGAGNFTSNSLFVPVMYNAAVISNAKKRLYETLGANLLLSAKMDEIPLSETPFSLKHTGSDFSVMPLQKHDRGVLVMTNPGGLRADGIYELVLNDSVYRYFAINYNRKESVMDFIPEDRLRDMLKQSGLKNFNIIETGGGRLLENMKSVKDSRDVWKLFIIFALLMLLAEVLILRFWK